MREGEPLQGQWLFLNHAGELSNPPGLSLFSPY